MKVVLNANKKSMLHIFEALDKNFDTSVKHKKVIELISKYNKEGNLPEINIDVSKK